MQRWTDAMRRLRSPLPVAMIAVAGIGATGAGIALADSESKSGESTEPKSEARAEFQDFRDCLREQGIEPPERGLHERGDRPDSREELEQRLEQRREEFEQKREELKQAMEACADELPEEARQRHEDAERFRSCMEENGVEEGESPDVDTYRSALEECAQYAPVPKRIGPGPFGVGGPGPHGGPGGPGPGVIGGPAPPPFEAS